MGRNRAALLLLLVVMLATRASDATCILRPQQVVLTASALTTACGSQLTPASACWLSVITPNSETLLVEPFVVPAQPASPPRYASVLRCAAKTSSPLCDVDVRGGHRVLPTQYLIEFTADTYQTSGVVDPSQYLRFDGRAWGSITGASWAAPNRLLVNCTGPATREDADAVVSVTIVKDWLRELPLNDLRRAGAAAAAAAGSGGRAESAVSPPVYVRTPGDDSNSAAAEPGIVTVVLPVSPGKYTVELCRWRRTASASESGESSEASEASKSNADNDRACSIQLMAAAGVDPAAEAPGTALSALSDTLPAPSEPAAQAALHSKPAVPWQDSVCNCEVVASAGFVAEDCDALLQANRTVVLLPGLAASSQTDTHQQLLTATQQGSNPQGAVAAAGAVTPWWHTRGVAAVGAKGLRIPHNSLPPRAVREGSWSMSMWLWIHGDAGEDRTTGAGPAGEHRYAHNYRVMFFKGHGNHDQSRTPSVWLDRDSNRLVMRASGSSAGESDLGGTSTHPLPTRTWLHVVFSFTNHTYNEKGVDAGGARGDPSYTFTVHVNGELDSALTYRRPVRITANTGPLWIGRDPQFAGTTGLISQLALYDEPLNGTAIKALYAQHAWLYRGETPAARDGTPAYLQHAAEQRALQGAEDDTMMIVGVVAATRVVSAWGAPLPWPGTAAAHAAAATQLIRELTSTHQKSQAVLACPRALLRGCHAGAGDATAGPACSADPSSRACVAERLAESVHSEDGSDTTAHAASSASSLQCNSAAEAEAWSWTLQYLGIEQDETGRFQVRSSVVGRSAHDEASAATSGGTAVRHAYLDFSEAWARDSELAVDYALPVLSDCDRRFADEEEELEASAEAAASESGEVADKGFGHVLTSTDEAGANEDTAETELSADGHVADTADDTGASDVALISLASDQQQGAVAVSDGANTGKLPVPPVYRRTAKTYTGALNMLMGAAAHGAGHPDAARAVADALLQPGRDRCGAEIRRTARRWSSRAQLVDQRANADAATDILAILAVPFKQAGHALSSAAALVLGGDGDNATESTAAASTTADVAAARTALPSAASLYRHPASARAMYAAAAMRGDATALYSWGVLLLTGVGGNPDAAFHACSPPHASGSARSALPSPFDAAFAAGLVHLAAAAGGGDGEPYFLLSRLYAGYPAGGPATAPARTDANLQGSSAAGRRYMVERSPKYTDKLHRALHTLLHPSGKGSSGSAAGYPGGAAAAHAFLSRHFASVSTGIPQDTELAAWYAEWAADVSDAAYHARGAAPFHEMQRLSTDAADSGAVEHAQRGDEDEAIRFQRMRADNGDVAAQLAMGDLLYWGARGVARDQPAARDYFLRAAEAGNVAGAVAAGGMLLKGEGGDANFTHAVLLYEYAASTANDTRALNGLGYAHYYGQYGVQQNYTAAYTYFRRAADNGGDGDSLFNAARCLQMGQGVTRNLTEAVSLFQAGVSKGHFGCIIAVGRMWAHGTIPVVVPGEEYREVDSSIRDAGAALKHLMPVAESGPWASGIRRGFDRYLAHDYDGAYLHYLKAYVLGFEVAGANAAYLLQRRLVDWKLLYGGGSGSGSGSGSSGADVQRASLARTLYLDSFSRGSADSLLPLADHLLAGTGGVAPDVLTAVALYAQASAAGSAQAAFTLAALYETGAGPVQSDPVRAEAYYRRVMELTPYGRAHAPVYLALARMRATAWLQASVLALTGRTPAEWMAAAAAAAWSAGDAGTTDAAETAAAYGEPALYWQDAAKVADGVGSGATSSSSWTLRLFALLMPDAAVNAPHERKATEDAGGVNTLLEALRLFGAVAAGVLVGAALLVAVLVRRHKQRQARPRAAAAVVAAAAGPPVRSSVAPVGLPAAVPAVSTAAAAAEEGGAAAEREQDAAE